MRVDQFLNKVCLIKTRSVAKKACDTGLISINDKQIKASQIVNDNDIIKFSVYGYNTTVKVLQVPTGNVSKKTALDYYETIDREKIDLE